MKRRRKDSDFGNFANSIPAKWNIYECFRVSYLEIIRATWVWIKLLRSDFIMRKFEGNRTVKVGSKRISKQLFLGKFPDDSYTRKSKVVNITGWKIIIYFSHRIKSWNLRIPFNLKLSRDWEIYKHAPPSFNYPRGIVPLHISFSIKA